MKGAVKDEIITNVTAKLNGGDTTSIHIPSHSSGGLGINTTQLFKALDSNTQYHHSVKVKPVRTVRPDEKLRKLRQQDLVVTAISNITERRWRADIDAENNVVLTINQAPVSVLKKNAAEIILDLKFLFQFITTDPVIGN
jgi:hypothetical protein